MDMNELELEVVELQFPSVYPVGTYVTVTKIIPSELRAIPNPSTRPLLEGQMGVIHSHRTRNGIRWNRVKMDRGGSFDFMTQELQKYE